MKAWLRNIKKRIREWLDIRKYLSYLNTRCRRNVYVVGTPNHGNVGDNAIAYAELRFLESCGIDRTNVKEITAGEYEAYGEYIVKRLRSKRRLILLHGGGNMGNQWLGEEQLRRQILGKLDINPVIILPQTFSYSKDEKGRKALEESVPYYNGRKNLTVTARERLSYELLSESYPDTNIILTPDIVISLNPEVLKLETAQRSGVLFLMRCDGERVLTDGETDKLKQAITDRGLTCRVSDMIAADRMWVAKSQREDVIKEKLSELASAELVITDRLHGMVFAAICNTPCIVLKNNNHKITGTYEWIKDLPFIKMADSTSQAAELVDELMKMSDCKYDSSVYRPLYSKLEAEIKKYL